MDQYFLSLVADVLKIDPGCLKRESTAESIPEWDSITHWTVISRLEEVYGIEFTLDEATEFKNLGDIYNTLLQKTTDKI
ncbi:MAG: acyl carrier protein [Ruminiclostridium sp.]|nr:acyl carrier protein [Ruminiclostridium sp.]